MSETNLAMCHCLTNAASEWEMCSTFPGVRQAVLRHVNLATTLLFGSH